MTGIFVIGPPRSGTSATTGVIAGMGPALCTVADRLGGGPNNPTGHWESSSVVTLNRHALETLGARWWCPPTQTTDWAGDPNLAHLRRRARRSFFAVHPSQGWLCKDPRLSITLPLWLSSVDAHPVVVLVVREATVTARSMVATWPLEPGHALALWERYFRSALAHARGLPLLVSPFRDLLSDPAGWYSRTAAFLGAHGITTAEPAPAAIASFLRTPRGEEGGMRPTPAQSELGQALEEMIGGHDAFDPPSLGAESSATEELLAGLRRDIAAGRPLDVRPRWMQGQPAGEVRGWTAGGGPGSRRTGT